METLYRKFVQEWMETHEPNTFIKDEHGRVMYTAGGTTINLVYYFEELLEDFDEKLKADKAELLEALEKISKVTNEGYITDDTDFQVWESELKQVHSEIESLIIKHKQ